MTEDTTMHSVTTEESLKKIIEEEDAIRRLEDAVDIVRIILPYLHSIFVLYIYAVCMFQNFSKVNT